MGHNRDTVRTRRLLLLVLAFGALGVVALAFLEVPAVSLLARLTVGAGVLLGLLWLLWRGLKAFLWKVGRRLAFTYFLIGVVPIPLVACLLLVGAYLLAGFFLGHLGRSGLEEVVATLEETATRELERFAATGRPGPATAGEVAFTYYSDGERVGGDRRAPQRWPAWVPDPVDGAPRHFVTRLGEDELTLALPAVTGEHAVLALYSGDLERDLTERTGIWIESHYPGEPEEPEAEPSAVEHMQVQIGGKQIPMRTLNLEHRSSEAMAFFAERARGEGWMDRPLLWWGELTGPVRRLTDGSPVAEFAVFTLNATPRMVAEHLFRSSSELDSTAWGTLLVVAFLLFDIYFVAVLMALFLIVGLSAAVNRLSRATAAVQGGDFSVRIPVRRRDQLGALQASFNRMAENLEQAVATATEKEVLEKELAIARDLQQSLIPRDLPAGDGVELASLFEPSAAIGGDYFDILRLGEDRLAVAVADVAGHGLPTGLRMAMLKAALTVLVERSAEPEEILRRLDGVVRSEGDSRFFVTATLAFLELSTGRLDIANAGHCPTYRLRDGEVEEILLPSPPLGTIGRNYARTTIELEAGDLVVWLSDGLIEATDEAGDAFGYERIGEVLASAPDSPEAVRDRLLAAVASHTGGREPDDDRTLVVLGFRGRRRLGPS